MSEELVAVEHETFGHFVTKALSNKSFLTGLVVTLLVAAAALVSFIWTPYAVTDLPVANRLKTPSADHWLGTDHFGRDILSMIMVGARNSIAVALVAVGIGMGIGVPLGCWAAARRGWIDEALMRFNDVVFAFPALLSAVMITAIFGPGAINAIHRHRDFQHPGVRACGPRCGAVHMAQGIRPGSACVRQECRPDHD